MGKDAKYNEDNPVVGLRLTPYKKGIVEDAAKRAGQSVQEFLDEIVLKEFFWSRGVKWPATLRGRAGAPKGNQNARKRAQPPKNGGHATE